MHTIIIFNLSLIIVSFIFLATTIKIIFKVSRPSNDHYANLSFIKDIKLNGHRFILKNSNIVDDKNFAYPQLMHFILSFFPFSFSEKKYLRINFITEILLYGFAVFTVYYFSGGDKIKVLGLASLLIVTNPFNRFIWNAKVSGISARNFGILTVYIYLFFFSSDIFTEVIYLRFAVFILLGFIIIISSQFATQFLLLFSLICIFFRSYYPAIAFPFSFLLFYIIMPTVFLSYLRGQYQHKKIWVKHLAKIDLLKNRYSVYRDFIYDFYQKKNLKYFLTNPLIEVLTGFPLIVVLAFIQPEIFTNNLVIFAAIASFILTSFRFTRFLGEPQRYVEMALPMLTFVAIKYLSTEQIYLVVIFNIIFFILHLNTFAKFYPHEIFHAGIRDEIKTLINKNIGNTHTILLGNNWGMPGYFLPEKNMQIMMPTFTSWQQYGVGIDKIFPEHLFSLDRSVAIRWIQDYRPGWFFLDEYYWPQSEFEKELKSTGISFSLKEEFKPVLLYQIENYE